MAYGLQQDNQVVYQANPNMAQQLKGIKDQIRNLCSIHLNRPVKVVTIDGYTYEGIIVSADDRFLYLSVTVQGDQRFLGAPGSFYYNNTILPLVLYELLVITLLM
ncbi:hypothetical protein [Paenibacillus sp. YPG26]|uniref:hypothetical protein n=1 Tax=Paenibacillus sp. YPG26 TaxID=2878915 RepID=UPI00203E69F5|nr:hypothetical protein [Paenibacillus sp. YPG26]USB34555.1 hypothetical protein LDO05_07275 [Paenibacillus sp. YPG26]